MQSFHSQIKLRSSVPRLMPISPWHHTLRLYQAPAFTTFALSGKFAHRWMTSVASALISSRLDQLNSILYGTSLKHIARLQRMQHAAARVVMNQHSRTCQLSSSEILKQLHWLPVEWRIRFNPSMSNGGGVKITPRSLSPAYLWNREIYNGVCL